MPANLHVWVAAIHANEIHQPVVSQVWRYSGPAMALVRGGEAQATEPEYRLPSASPRVESCPTQGAPVGPPESRRLPRNCSR